MRNSLLDLDALIAARQWAADHGAEQPDDRMLIAYGEIIQAKALDDAARAASKIGQRIRDQANEKTGDDRKWKHAQAAGASLVAIKLIELSAGIGLLESDAGPNPPAGEA